MNNYLTLKVADLANLPEQDRAQVRACAVSQIFDKLLFDTSSECLKRWKDLPFTGPQKRISADSAVTDANRRLLEQMEAAGLSPQTASEQARHRGCCDPPTAS
jgi:hypothetical protein